MLHPAAKHYFCAKPYNMRFVLKSFAELDIYELYDIMRVRQEVFIVEQTCPYQDADGKDLKSQHLMGYNEADQLLVYARLVPPGVSYPNDCSIGRVLSTEQARGTGAGRLLMAEAMQALAVLYPGVDVRISAQSYLVQFYADFGFVSTGKSYLEDDIPHTEMLFKN